MSDLPTKKPTLEELREKLEHLEIQLQGYEQRQSNLYEDGYVEFRKRHGKQNVDRIEQELKENIARLNAEIKALNEVMYEAWHPTFPKRPSIFQKLKTKLPSKRGRSQSVSQ
jgi:hypothetical protein